MPVMSIDIGRAKVDPGLCHTRWATFTCNSTFHIVEHQAHLQNPLVKEFPITVSRIYGQNQ
jgi:hypothetical protein